MGNKKSCSKINAFRQEFFNDWYMLNLQAKSLILLGFLMLFATIFISCLPNFPKEIGVLFRSLLSSIFGFFLSSNLKADKSDKKVLNQFRCCDDTIEKYNFKDGNMIQIIIAVSICLISIFSIVFVYGFGLSSCVPTLSQLGSFTSSSIGFLLGEAKIKK